jgi:hypothetical protein
MKEFMDQDPLPGLPIAKANQNNQTVVQSIIHGLVGNVLISI